MLVEHIKNYNHLKGYVKVSKLENFNGHISNFDYTPLTNLDFNASVSNRKEHHDDWQRRFYCWCSNLNAYTKSHKC